MAAVRPARCGTRRNCTPCHRVACRADSRIVRCASATRRPPRAANPVGLTTKGAANAASSSPASSPQQSALTAALLGRPRGRGYRWTARGVALPDGPSPRPPVQHCRAQICDPPRCAAAGVAITTISAAAVSACPRVMASSPNWRFSVEPTGNGTSMHLRTTPRGSPRVQGYASHSSALARTSRRMHPIRNSVVDSRQIGFMLARIRRAV